MINSLFDLSGKVVLITGGANGIGLAIAQSLTKAGAKVCINGRSEDKLATCKAEFAQQGIDIFTVAFDVTSETDVDRGISLIEKEVGDIDILVNNAGIIKRVKILDMPV